MKTGLVAVAAVLAASSALAQTAAVPNTLKEAVAQGYEVVGAVGQNASNQDHVVYLKKGAQLVVCGFRFVLTDRGFDPEKSGNLGVCTNFQ
jgi:2-methylcitrate dehydratase PrpD